jgi:DNA-directed RNA polymerase subunit E'/Rpb7
MAQISLYYHTELDTKVPILSKQINGSLNDHLLNNLKMQVEGKTDDHGLILKVDKIINYDYGYIDGVNFVGNTIYNVKYKCLLCSPTKNIEFTCIIDNIVKGILVGKNGPITVAIQHDHIDAQKFKLVGDNVTEIKTGRVIEKGDYLKVSVIRVKMHTNETNLTVTCKLLGIASDNDVKKYKEEQKIVLDKSEDDNENQFI